MDDRQNVISVRLTRDEYRQISQAAAKNRLSISEYMRSCSLEDQASSLDQLRIEVREQEEVLEHIIFMIEMLQQTNLELFTELNRKLMKIDGDTVVGESEQDFRKRTDAEAQKLIQRVLNRAVNKEVSLHITGDWDTKDPLCLRQYENKVAEYIEKDS